MRRLSLLALALAAFAITACADATAPTAKSDCTEIQGSSTKCD